MRQVPRYLIIGRGRLATHLAHYFTLLGNEFSLWHRDLTKQDLENFSSQATHVLFLIKDDAIEPFLSENFAYFSHQILIHFSGALIAEKIVGCHPLMTFSANSHYTLQEYQAIPFVLDNKNISFKTLFPNFENPVFFLSQDQKAKYHALCALAGNLTSYLWQQIFTVYEKDFGFSKEIAFPYLKQIANNLLSDSDNALTGPVARNDQTTIKKHLSSLEDTHLLDLYQAFIKSFLRLKGNNNENT